MSNPTPHFAGIGDFVDLERFGLDQPRGERWQAAVTEARAGLAATGCARLSGFLRSDAVEAMAAETEAFGHLAHHTTTHHNPYFSMDDPGLPEGDPRRVFQTRTNGMLCYDQVPAEGPLRQLFAQDALRVFLADCLEEPVIYRYADPISAFTVNIMNPGDAFPWHFDTNEFSVSVQLRAPEAGGVFEYAPAIRTAEAENYEDVAAVLRGLRDDVTSLVLQPGDLQIFKGRFSMHRVTRCEGNRPRYTFIAGYTLEPNVIGEVEHQKRIYGRVTQAHLDAAAANKARSGELASAELRGS